MSCLILFAEVGCRSFAPPLSITIQRGIEPLSWYQKNYIHGIEVGAPVTNKSSNQVKRIISQHLSVRQISCLVQSLCLNTLAFQNKDIQAIQQFSSSALQHFSLSAYHPIIISAFQICSILALNYFRISVSVLAFKHFSISALKHFSISAFQHFLLSALQNLCTLVFQFISLL